MALNLPDFGQQDREAIKNAYINSPLGFALDDRNPQRQAIERKLAGFVEPWRLKANEARKASLGPMMSAISPIEVAVAAGIEKSDKPFTERLKGQFQQGGDIVGALQSRGLSPEMAMGIGLPVAMAIPGAGESKALGKFEDLIKNSKKMAKEMGTNSDFIRLVPEDIPPDRSISAFIKPDGQIVAFSKWTHKDVANELGYIQDTVNKFVEDSGLVRLSGFGESRAWTVPSRLTDKQVETMLKLSENSPLGLKNQWIGYGGVDRPATQVGSLMEMDTLLKAIRLSASGKLSKSIDEIEDILDSIRGFGR